MKPDQIKRIAVAAEAHGKAILERFLPGGKAQGKEYVVKNPHRDDAKAGSLSINWQTGKGKDFATDEAFGDFVAVVAFALRCDMSEAAGELAKFIGCAIDSLPAPPPSSKTESGERVLMPVPGDSPAVPQAHHKRGRPDVTYTYRDADGNVLGYILRFEAKKDNKKEFIPLTLWSSLSGKAEWKWNIWPVPRPLYGLNYLAAGEDMPVLVVEGEKAADSICGLLSRRFVVLSWPGGASSVGKIDFRPLAGRDVVLWPDNDLPGLTAMEKVKAAALKAGAKSVVTLDVRLLAKIDAAPSGAIIDRLGSLPVGWDAADAVKEGWGFQHFEALFDNPKAYLTEAPDHEQDQASENAVTGPYALDDTGLYQLDSRGDEVRQVRICAPIRIPALARDPEGGSWSPVCEFDDRDGRRRREIIPYRLLVGDGNDGVKTLVDLGLGIASGRDTPSRLRNYIMAQQPTPRASLLQQCGWHGNAYVLPEGAVGETDEILLLRDAARMNGIFARRGNLDEWKDRIARLAEGNERLMFTLSVAFAGPLLKICGAASMTFHWVGDSSIGKSGALVAAGSVWGPVDHQVMSWRQTSNAVEYALARHNDGTPVLDEFKEVDPKEAAAIVYMTANAKGKGRARHDGGLRDSTSWRVAMLSSGEIGLADHLASVGQKRYAGQEVRFIELPGDAGLGRGMWSELHGLADGKTLTDVLKRQASRYHGSAGRAFVGRLVTELETIQERWRKHDQDFARRFAPTSAGGQVLRVLSSFSLVAMAGELATEWGVVPWETGDATQAAGRLFNAWLTERPTAGNAEDAQIIAHVRGVLERNWQARFVDWHRVTEGTSKLGSDYEAASNSDGLYGQSERGPDLSRMAAVHDSLGFRKRDEGFSGDSPAYLFYVTRQRFKEEFSAKGGFNYKRVSALLKTMGVLKCDPDSSTLKEALPNGDPRSYCIIGRALFALEG